MNDNSYTPYPTAATSPAAIISLIAGIASWFIAPLLGAIIAIVSGHLARREIRSSNGNLTGDGLAVAGLVLGYGNLIIGGLTVCALIAFLALGLSIPLLCIPFANQIGQIVAWFMA
ncbi:MAG: hypothetical protein OHK0052_11750 [Anaerolineales bacterium]